jgi:two-component system chemotaxis response regulator CheB
MIPKQAVFIGASAGGITAIQNLFLKLKDRCQQPMIFVQHLISDSQFDLSMVFGAYTKLQLREVQDKMKIESGYAYFAPAGYHLLIEKDLSFSLSQDEPVHFSRPSIDVCFESAAEVFGASACAILLTGANSDGAQGLKCIQAQGGYTMVQDPSEAEFSTMPKSALEIMKPEFIGTLDRLSSQLIELQKGSHRDQN